MLQRSTIPGAARARVVRTILAAAALLPLALGPLAGAADARPFDDTPCAKDANGLCGAQRPGLRPIRECLLKGHQDDKLEAACSDYIEELHAERRAAVEQKRDDFWKYCEKDVEKLCAEFRKTTFQARTCLHKRREKLSKQCDEHVPQMGAYRGPGWAGIKDPSETPEMRIERAERLRPGTGGDQARRKLALEAMSDEERKAFLAKERVEAAERAKVVNEARMKDMNERSNARPQPSEEERAQRRAEREAKAAERLEVANEAREKNMNARPKAWPQLSEEERAQRRAERAAKAAERQAEWQKRREEWAQKRAERVAAGTAPGKASAPGKANAPGSEGAAAGSGSAAP